MKYTSKAVNKRIKKRSVFASAAAGVFGVPRDVTIFELARFRRTFCKQDAFAEKVAVPREYSEELQCSGRQEPQNEEARPGDAPQRVVTRGQQDFWLWISASGNNFEKLHFIANFTAHFRLCQ